MNLLKLKTLPSTDGVDLKVRRQGDDLIAYLSTGIAYLFILLNSTTIQKICKKNKRIEGILYSLTKMTVHTPLRVLPSYGEEDNNNLNPSGHLNGVSYS